MTPDEIIARLVQVLPEAKVTLEDLRDDGTHHALTVTHPAFAGVSLVDQHRRVHAAFATAPGGWPETWRLTTRSHA